MNKEEYLRQLERALRRMPKDSRLPALEYYREYFEEAGPENEASVIEEFGPPKQLAAQIIRERAEKSIDTPNMSTGKKISAIWLAILALFAAPFGLPLSFAAVLVLMAVLLVIVIFAACLLLAGAAIFIGGLFSLPVGVYIMFSHAADGISILGAGLLLVGLGFFALRGAVRADLFIFRGIYHLFRKRLTGGKKHEK